ncbi:MAG: LLM class flavin-dependent oxidoreductase [Alphaproteobacteria bacterium]|nr:LLM class flavin-dependent oxidoreductase [Alphaproteobacteria bacterium]
MKIGNFLFPDSRDPGQDGTVIDETVQEAVLSDTLGVDVIWLAEHHFDGICAYVDPIVFAGALSVLLKQSRLGFAVVQTSLHHPVRLAEQIAVLDNLLKGRLIVGLGRGTAYNIYDYQGFGLDHNEAQPRLEEAEQVMLAAWRGGAIDHHGRFWQLRIPELRPRPFTRPHPFIIRGASSGASLIELARTGRPFLMNVQSNEVTRHRVDLYRREMAAAGYGEEQIATNLEQSWIWRNLFVADTDAEAERVAVPAFRAMNESRAAMRERVFAETGQRIAVPPGDSPERRAAAHGLVRGSPATVAAAFADIERLGVGGVIASFRLGPLPYEVAARSLSLFMREVAPLFRAPHRNLGPGNAAVPTLTQPF